MSAPTAAALADPDHRARFSLAELKDILYQRNELKAKVSDLQDQLTLLQKPEESQALTQYVTFMFGFDGSCRCLKFVNSSQSRFDGGLSDDRCFNSPPSKFADSSEEKFMFDGSCFEPSFSPRSGMDSEVSQYALISFLAPRQLSFNNRVHCIECSYCKMCLTTPTNSNSTDQKTRSLGKPEYSSDQNGSADLHSLNLLMSCSKFCLKMFVLDAQIHKSKSEILASNLCIDVSFSEEKAKFYILCSDCLDKLGIVSHPHLNPVQLDSCSNSNKSKSSEFKHPSPLSTSNFHPRTLINLNISDNIALSVDGSVTKLQISHAPESSDSISNFDMKDSANNCNTVRNIVDENEQMRCNEKSNQCSPCFSPETSKFLPDLTTECNENDEVFPDMTSMILESKKLKNDFIDSPTKYPQGVKNNTTNSLLHSNVCTTSIASVEDILTAGIKNTLHEGCLTNIKSYSNSVTYKNFQKGNTLKSYATQKYYTKDFVLNDDDWEGYFCSHLNDTERCFACGAGEMFLGYQNNYFYRQNLYQSTNNSVAPVIYFGDRYEEVLYEPAIILDRKKDDTSSKNSSNRSSLNKNQIVWFQNNLVESREDLADFNEDEESNPGLDTSINQNISTMANSVEHYLSGLTGAELVKLRSLSEGSSVSGLIEEGNSLTAADLSLNVLDPSDSGLESLDCGMQCDKYSRLSEYSAECISNATENPRKDCDKLFLNSASECNENETDKTPILSDDVDLTHDTSLKIGLSDAIVDQIGYSNACSDLCVFACSFGDIKINTSCNGENYEISPNFNHLKEIKLCELYDNVAQLSEVDATSFDCNDFVFGFPIMHDLHKIHLNFIYIKGSVHPTAYLGKYNHIYILLSSSREMGVDINVFRGAMINLDFQRLTLGDDYKKQPLIAGGHPRCSNESNDNLNLSNDKYFRGESICVDKFVSFKNKTTNDLLHKSKKPFMSETSLLPLIMSCKPNIKINVSDITNVDSLLNNLSHNLSINDSKDNCDKTETKTIQVLVSCKSKSASDMCADISVDKADIFSDQSGNICVGEIMTGILLDLKIFMGKLFLDNICKSFNNSSVNLQLIGDVCVFALVLRFVFLFFVCLCRIFL